MALLKYDLTGKRFGRLTAIERKKGPRSVWVCQCDCGNMAEVDSSHLRSGATKSCGCWRKDQLEMRKAQHVGKRFGDTTVLRISPTSQELGRTELECLCGCGNTFTISAAKLSKRIRNNRPVQCRNCSRKISDDDVRFIREERARGASLAELVERFDVDPSYISLIARGLRR